MFLQWNLSNPDTNGQISEVSSFQRRVVLGVGKGVLFREVSSVQDRPHRERERERGSTVLIR